MNFAIACEHFLFICALCKIVNSEISEFELISVIFPHEMCRIENSLGDLHRFCDEKNVCDLATFFVWAVKTQHFIGHVIVFSQKRTVALCFGFEVRMDLRKSWRCSQNARIWTQTLETSDIRNEFSVWIKQMKCSDILEFTPTFRIKFVRILWPICAFCKILNFSMSKFECFLQFFRGNVQMAKSWGDLHRLCNDKNVYNLGANFCLRFGSTALHIACKNFLAEPNSGTLFRFEAARKIRIVWKYSQRERIWTQTLKTSDIRNGFSVWIQKLKFSDILEFTAILRMKCAHFLAHLRGLQNCKLRSRQEKQQDICARTRKLTILMKIQFHLEWWVLVVRYF